MEKISEKELKQQMQELTNERIKTATEDFNEIAKAWSEKHNCMLSIELKLQGFQLHPTIAIVSK